MSAATKTWNVRPNRFPFGVATEILGVVTGDDRKSALEKATDLYGRGVVVELAHAGPNSPEHSRVARRAENGAPRPLPGPLAVDRNPLRPMTPDEVELARVVSSLAPIGKHPQKALIRHLHGRTFRPAPSISVLEAEALRAVARQFAAYVPPQLLERAGGAS